MATSQIARILSLTDEEQRVVAEPLGRLETLLQWASSALEAAKESRLSAVLGTAADGAKEWSGTLRATSKVLGALTKEREPAVLAWLACTIGYRHAAEDAIRLQGRPSSRVPFSGAIVSEQLSGLRLEDHSIMDGFSLTSPTSHPFLRAADQALLTILEAAAYNDAERRIVLRNVRASFRSNLQEILTGHDREKFLPFVEWLKLDTDDRRLDAALREYAEIQRAAFEDLPALGVEPFAVATVFTRVECGILSWKSIRDEHQGPNGPYHVDPFAEGSAPRMDLLDTVLAHMADPAFGDAVVIQGAPGAGKSTFTRRLSVELQLRGLIPIRVPMGQLRVDMSLFDSIQDVILSQNESSTYTFRRDLLIEKVLSDKVPFGRATISPYVFIFDGWDEVSLSAAEGFQQRIEHLLQTIRQTFMGQRRTLIRVVLTGRPSEAVGRTNFLLDDTPVLTIRPLQPDALQSYVHSLAAALEHPEFTGEDIDQWKLGDSERYRPVLARYAKAFPNVASLDVLGQPLLAHLALKVMARFDGPLAALLETPTTLYRHLVELTCKRGGKHPYHSATGTSGRIEGKDLRSLLHGTALAITAHGREANPTEELELRLETLGVGNDIFQLTRERSLTNLMISFYFKTAHERSGCEFLHKSFREYLTAEAIVELLKQYGRKLESPLAERPSELYWRDFEDDDPRSWLKEKLGEVLSAQWLSSEVVKHIEELINWEVSRAALDSLIGADSAPVGLRTEMLPFDRWERVRDSLADLWDWWAEGLHLRPQPRLRQKTWMLDTEPYVVELVRLSMRRTNYNRSTPPRPPRTTTIDAHLGYGLFELNCFLHAAVCQTKDKTAFRNSALWERATPGPRRYQVQMAARGGQLVRFAPSGKDPEYFRNYALRISGAGVRDFPANATMLGVDFRAADLQAVDFRRADMRFCSLQESKLWNTLLDVADLTRANLDGVRGSHMDLTRAKLTSTSLVQANLFNAVLFDADVHGADFANANLFLADLRYVHLDKVKNLTQEQVDAAATGCKGYKMPSGVVAPEYWENIKEETAELVHRERLRRRQGFRRTCRFISWDDLGLVPPAMALRLFSLSPGFPR